MLRVPLDADGLIDQVALEKRPAMATFRRFWPNEPDQTGYLLRNGNAWLFSYAVGDDEDEDEKVYHLEAHPLRIGSHVTVTEANGETFPFRVVHSQPDRVTDV